MKAWHFIAGVFAAAAVATIASRGERNNNPLNIRRSRDEWRGLAPKQNDPEFFQFISPEYGFRAAYKTLLTYRNKYGLKTIAGIINRWAPPSENDTRQYIGYISEKTGFDPHAALPLDLYPRLLLHMAELETGKEYPAGVIEKGVSLA